MMSMSGPMVVFPAVTSDPTSFRLGIALGTGTIPGEGAESTGGRAHIGVTAAVLEVGHDGAFRLRARTAAHSEVFSAVRCFSSS